MRARNRKASPVSHVRLRPLRLGSALLAGFFFFGAWGGCGEKEKTAEEKVIDELGLDEERGGDLTKRVTKLEAEEHHYGEGGGGGGLGLGGGAGGIGGLRGPGLGSPSEVVADVRGTGGDLDELAERVARGGRAEEAFTERTIIKTGTLLIHVDDVDKALARVQEVVAAHDGELVKVERHRYADDDSCVVVVRVPAARFDGAIASTRKIGEVVELTVEAEDVTEEYVDLQMRLDNQIKARDRFIEILNTRTGKLEDVVALQREINETTEEIERLSGKILYLRSRAALSSIYITLRKPTEEKPAAKEEKPSVLEQVLAALGDAVAGLFGIILFLVQVAIVAVPLAAVALLALVGARRLYLWARRRGVVTRILDGADGSKKE